MVKNLIIQFEGWCLIRVPTDPDPPDEPRGISGYTFAFGNEPDLDRLIYLQQPKHFDVRTHSPKINVHVTQAFSLEGTDKKNIGALVNAKVNLLDRPSFENRNWVLTLPGQEPIEPFHLEIQGDGIILHRTAPIDPKSPEKPIWLIDQELILAHGARGMEYEPATIGEATGIWDSLAIAVERKNKLEADLKQAEVNLKQEKIKQPEDADKIKKLEAKIAILEGRIHQLQTGISTPKDRRIGARYFVERFGFPMLGEAFICGDQQRLLNGILSTDRNTPWFINFWMGGWDPDLLCAFMQGSLQIPYQT